MHHIKLTNLIAEQYQPNNSLAELLEKDLQQLQEIMMNEGLWDTIKKSAGSVGSAAKEMLVKPLVKAILNKIATDDPSGFAQLKQHAAEDPSKIEKLLSHPSIERERRKVEKELQTVQEVLTEEETENFINEYIDAVLEEARAAGARAGGTAAGGTATRRPTRNSSAVSTFDKVVKGAKKFGKSAGKFVDKYGAKAIKSAGDFATGSAVTSAVDAAKDIGGGIISRIRGLLNRNKKLTAKIGLGLLAALLVAGSISSGGLIPYIASILATTAVTTVGGAAAGAGLAAAGDVYQQVKGGRKKLSGVDYKRALKKGVSGIKPGAKLGAKIGAAYGAI